MANIRVLIVDDNDELRGHLAHYFRQQQDITVVGEAGNGMDALKLINEKQADVMLLDMIMPSLDGFGVLAQMQRLSPEKRPRVIAVMYYMIKPVEMAALLDRVRDVMRQNPAAPVDSGSIYAPGLSLDDRLSNLFLGMGIPAHIKGYQYLREAIKLVVENPPMIGGITKELYPAIARRFNTTSSKVERAIRHAIEVAWSRGRVDTLNRALGCAVAQPDEKPTNGEFIALIADKLSMEHTA